jgi:hypothetical protein
MKKIILWIALCVAWLSILNPLRAADGISYNVTEVAIFGGGNPDGGWSIDLQNPDPLTSVKVGLRFKDRSDGTISTDSAGTYYSSTGFAVAGAPRTKWNIEWTGNSDVSGLTGKDLTDYIFTLMFDTDPSPATVWGVSFNPFDPILDSSYGNNATANGAGVEDFSPQSHNVGQNSQNGGFFPYGVNGLVTGTYDARMTATTLGGAPVAQIGITLVVPEAETYVAGIAMTMLVGYGFYRRIRK